MQESGTSVCGTMRLGNRITNDESCVRGMVQLTAVAASVRWRTAQISGVAERDREPAVVWLSSTVYMTSA